MSSPAAFKYHYKTSIGHNFSGTHYYTKYGTLTQNYIQVREKTKYEWFKILLFSILVNHETKLQIFNFT